ncbi:MAG: carboxypeptidase regulatory-like domain-containing protein [Terracidiphilus sp.]
MNRSLWWSAAWSSLSLLALFLCTLPAMAQQTLGSLNGTVVDASRAAVAGATVTAVNDQTTMTRSTKTANSGFWQILDLPVGRYTVTIMQSNYQTEKFPHIQVQEARAATLNATLKVGQVSQAVTVTANPLLNATDTTNGYTLDQAQIAATPLATGSFTQLAILAPGVNAQLIAGVGTNQGLGNQDIWSNGQRSTSNLLTLNGVPIGNTFNGQTDSEQVSQRMQFNIGEGSSVGGQAQDNISTYGSNGNGLASPPPEFMQEISVTTSMYDATQGQTSGAHIDVVTSSGSNRFHGQVYGLFGNNFMNADPFFYKQDVLLGSLSPQLENPALHKWVAGATLGGPIKKNKLFFFLGYQHLYTSDQYGALSQFQVPYGLSSDRSLAGIEAACSSYSTATLAGGGSSSNAKCPAITAFNPAAVGLLQAKLPNGNFLIPSPTVSAAQAEANLANEEPDVTELGTSMFSGDQATASLDYNATSTDHVEAKYFYQHMPTTSPYAISSVPGFPNLEDTGAQDATLSNSINIGSNFNWQQLIGISRQKVYGTYNPALTASGVGITMPGADYFPGLELEDFAQYNSESTTSKVGPYNYSWAVGSGYFENKIFPSTSAIWSLGKHTLTVGFSYTYDQLNVLNHGENHAEMETRGFSSFLEGKLYDGDVLEGNSDRYYRDHDIGAYASDKWQFRSNISISAGIRYDFIGPFSEKNGDMFNFDPSLYSATDSAIANTGFVIAGNNKLYGTPGVSASTMTGRQWGIGPRVGLAWSPKFNNGKVVWRAGFGVYYDQGEYFQYLSPPAGAGISGPFGVTQEAPFAAYTDETGNLSQPFPTLVTPTTPANTASIMPTVDSIEAACTTYNVYNDVSADMLGYNCNDGAPNAGLIIGNYNRANKLPYTEDWTLNFQWQPTANTVLNIGYVGNVGKHQVIPVPFNEPVQCTPGNYQTLAACHGQEYSYSVQVLSNVNAPSGYYGAGNKYSTPYAMASEPVDSYSGGNIDLRVPYVGIDPNATSFEAAGISTYNALQVNLNKTLSHGIQGGVSYTWSHTLDEQSDVGLFFTGSNPANLRSAYASSDFDETNNLTFNFLFHSPTLIKNKANFLGALVNHWSLLGVAVFQSGFPYSYYDYSGSVGGQYFGTNEEEMNPILPLKPGIDPKSALTGQSGAFTAASTSSSGKISPIYNRAVNPSDFEIPLIAQGTEGVPPCDTTTDGGNAGPGGGPLCDVYETDFVPGQRNIFREAFQKEGNIAIEKDIPIKERYDIRYQFEVFNVTNTPSFDIPEDELTLNPDYSELTPSTSYYANNGTQSQPSASTSVTTPTGTATCSGAAAACAYELYTAPNNVSSNKTMGVVENTLGLNRTVEMSLHLTF